MPGTMLTLGTQWWTKPKNHCFQNTTSGYNQSVWASYTSVHFNSVTQLCQTLWDPMNCSTTGFPVPHQLLEFTQTHVHWVGDAIQPSHPLSSPSPPTFNLSQYQGLFQLISLHKVAKVLEFLLQHQSPKNIQDWFPLGSTDWISL